ncbi:MAG TPA: YbaB/EbfC family nucleoid-associated protein [Kiritimatiellia bacterium]|nr:YbaB/EbfC family nucleoid-associated protein [Kiritimatiellia bacterium]HQN79523.1 YbaB/EbfC family nucleoid-associated protein [Kiritimatiellia bacterium]HQQ59733.1 YbaB/EbfC family nucleoid-associated protein [Kiritimatiellia bacterium]
MKLMKQAADMQKSMAKAQESLAAIELEHSAGGGAVTVKIMGDGNIAAIRIDPKVAQAGDTEMLEDLVLTAVRGAQDLAKETAASEMKKLTAGMGLPPGMGF